MVTYRMYFCTLNLSHLYDYFQFRLRLYWGALVMSTDMYGALQIGILLLHENDRPTPSP